MSVSSYSQKTIDQILECPICMDTFAKPKVLPCQHAFCLDCVFKLYNDNIQLKTKYRLICPICRETYQLKMPKTLRSLQVEDLDARLQNHFVLAQLLESKQEVINKMARRKSTIKRKMTIVYKNSPMLKKKCKACNKEISWFCVTCDCGFCNECVSNHFDTDADHEVYDLETQALCEKNEHALKYNKENDQLQHVGSDSDLYENPAENRSRSLRSVSEGNDSPDSSQVNHLTIEDRIVQGPIGVNPIGMIPSLNNLRINEDNTGSEDKLGWDAYSKWLTDFDDCISEALILDSHKTKILSLSIKEEGKQFSASEIELSYICEAFGHEIDVAANGITLESSKYIACAVESNLLFGKRIGSGLFIFKTNKTIILVIYKGEIREAVVAREAIEHIGNYLVQNSY